MAKGDPVAKTADFIKQKFSQESTGHDWWHMYRVWRSAKFIASKEKGADAQIVELAALLHDIADHKFHAGSTEAGPRAAQKWLQSIKVDDNIIDHVVDVVRHISFKTAKHKNDLKTIEGKIVHDADKLDAMGAIGIARCFAYGGAKGRLIYDPSQSLDARYTYEAAVMDNTSAIHHFYEKLLLLEGRMLTKTGKQLAATRHRYMEEFLDEFYKEWDAADLG